MSSEHIAAHKIAEQPAHHSDADRIGRSGHVEESLVKEYLQVMRVVYRRIASQEQPGPIISELHWTVLHARITGG